MKRLTQSVIAGCLLLLAAGAAQAGVAVSTHIGITSTTVLTGHESEATDAYTAYYYDMRTDGFIWEDSSLEENGSQTLANYSSVALSMSASAGHVYIAQTNHWVVTYFPSGSYWNDYVGWSAFSPISVGSPTTANPPFQQYYPSTQSHYIASGYLGDTTDAPHINAIVITGSATPGGSGYIEVYGTDLAKWAGSTTSNISGSGVSTNVVYQDYTNPYQVNLSYSITSGATPGNRNLTVDTPWGAPSNAVTFTIGDVSPNITSISPSTWEAGASTPFTIAGTGFSNNPNVTENSSYVTFTGLVKGDEEITGTAVVAAGAPVGSVSVTVTSVGASGSGFQAPPTGGQGAADTDTATVVTGISMELTLEEDGFSIEPGNNYSENTIIRVTAVRSDTGAPLTSWTGMVSIQEDGTNIYSQNGGSLPSTVTVSSGGYTTFVAKSLAGPLSATEKPASAHIVTSSGSSAYAVYNAEGYLAIPQWRDTILFESRFSGAMFDWLKARIEDILGDTGNTTEEDQVLDAVSTFSMGATGYYGLTSQNWGSVSPVEINPYWETHRLDSSDTNGVCDATETVPHNLTNTVFHEARHAFMSQLATTTNDQDEDGLLLAAPTIAPVDVMIDSNAPRSICDQINDVVTNNVTFSGDSIPDNATQVEEAMEYDAHHYADGKDN